MSSDTTHRITSTSREFREKVHWGTCIIICFNVNFTDECIEQLRSIISEVHIFTDLDECVDFTTNVEREKVLLILNESMGESLISILHDFDQVYEIYVFRTDQKNCKRWINNNCPKYKGVFDVFTSLCHEIRRVARLYERDAVTINLLSDSKTSVGHIDSATHEEEDFNTQEASFMYFQIISVILLEMNEDDPTDMIHFCRLEYTGNNSALTAVRELEQDYRNHSPIWWYTREGFLYKILNKALREQDVCTLYSLRIFVSHLYKQLVDMFVSQSQTRREEMKHNNTNSTTFTLYRGQQMTTQSFEKIKNNVGGLLSFSNFLSTTANKNLALIYAGNTVDNANFNAVLFQLEIDTITNKCPFADVGSISYFGEAEEEYLFAMGSIFRVQRVEKLNDEVWNIQLMMTNEYDAKLTELAAHLLTESECNNPLLSLAKVLWRLDDHEKAKFFYLKALEKETGWKQRAGILQDLGTTCIENSTQALDYFHQALEIVQQHIKGDYDPIYSSIYNNIGAVYQNMGDNDLALVYFKETLDRELCAADPNKRKLCTRYSNIGMILMEQEEKDESERYLQKALNMALDVLPSMHPSIAEYYSNLASCMSTMGRFVEAVDYQQKAVDIYSAGLPANHQQNQRSQQSLKMYEDSLNMLTLVANMSSGAVGLVLGDGSCVYPRRK
jgi:tetratricopeptide (TPR) repeat protein